MYDIYEYKYMEKVLDFICNPLKSSLTVCPHSQKNTFDVNSLEGISLIRNVCLFLVY